MPFKLTSFTINEKNMVINTFKHVKESWPSDQYPYRREMANKTANILGVAVSSIYKILKDYKEKNTISAPVTTKAKPNILDKIDDFDKSAIRKKVHSFFLKGELPTLKKVLSDADETMPNFKRTTFTKLLKHLKFKYVKRQRNNFITDRDDIVMWRRKYLQKIKNYRSNNRKIYYMDETWINAG